MSQPARWQNRKDYFRNLAPLHRGVFMRVYGTKLGADYTIGAIRLRTAIGERPWIMWNHMLERVGKDGLYEDHRFRLAMRYLLETRRHRLTMVWVYLHDIGLIFWRYSTEGGIWHRVYGMRCGDLCWVPKKTYFRALKHTPNFVETYEGDEKKGNDAAE